MALVADKMRKVRPRRFGHVKKRCTDASEKVREVSCRGYEEV